MNTTREEPSDAVVDPRVVRSRARILEAATDLLVDGGAPAVTVDAVSERSGVAKTTMYRHFPSSTDLLVAVLRHSKPNLTVPVDAGSFEDALRSGLQAVASALADPKWARILPALMALKYTNPEVFELTEVDRTELTALTGAILDRGVAEGLVPADVDVATTTMLLVGPLVLTVLHGDLERLPRLADEIAATYVAACRHRAA